MSVNNPRKATMEKRVLVTGATRGIGKAIAQKFKSESWYVIGTGTQLQDKPSYLDGYFACDLNNKEEIDLLLFILKHERINTLVNNAGINIIDNFLDIRLEDFEKVHNVNVVAPMRLSQSVIPHMVEQGWGRIVNISSVWGKISKQGRASYSASKFGIDGLTLAMANEFASQGILCNCVAPGFIDTEMTWNNLGIEGVNKMLETVPIKRLAKVEEVANLVFMLGSENNTYISGQNIAIDGGFTRA
jgi:NAD(P)-dependent dehydrogenase (short-subunit alcohol dehydrogenase family)